MVFIFTRHCSLYYSIPTKRIINLNKKKKKRFPIVSVDKIFIDCEKDKYHHEFYNSEAQTHVRLYLIKNVV